MNLKLTGCSSATPVQESIDSCIGCVDSCSRTTSSYWGRTTALVRVPKRKFLFSDATARRHLLDLRMPMLGRPVSALLVLTSWCRWLQIDCLHEDAVIVEPGVFVDGGPPIVSVAVNHPLQGATEAHSFPRTLRDVRCALTMEGRKRGRERLAWHWVDIWTMLWAGWLRYSWGWRHSRTASRRIIDHGAV